MKKVIFGSACLISGVLLGLLIQQAGPAAGPGPGGIGLIRLLGCLAALALGAGGLYLGISGLRDDH